MCTVSWSRSADQTVLFFNRDEQRTRSPALPPARHTDPRSGVFHVAPTDPDGGGTWIGVNEHGLAVCLLNTYDRPGSGTTPTRSRGRLVRDLLRVRGTSSLPGHLADALGKETYAPCLILCLTADTEPRAYRIEASHLTPVDPPRPFITTCSVRRDEVVAWRTRQYERGVADPAHPRPEELERLHALQDPGDPARGIVMSRPDATTVSRTRLTLARNDASLHYQPIPDDGVSSIAIQVRAF